MIETRGSNPLKRTKRQTALTGLIIEVFRLNGSLLAAGDLLVSDLGLSSARWQVLGAIDGSPVPLPVAHLARNMGLTRQAVQRSVDEMKDDGFVRLVENPHHRRAMLVVMTDKGEAAYRAALDRQSRWAETVARDLSSDEMTAASTVLRALQRRLDQGAGTDAVLPKTSNSGV